MDYTHLIERDHAAWCDLYGRGGNEPIWHTLPFLGELVEVFREHRCYKIMDAGCGDGGQSRSLPEDLLVIAVDQSANAIADAELHLKCAHRRNYVALRSLMQKTPFQDTSLDAVLCVDVLTSFPDPEPVLREFRRLIHPGGICITTTFAPTDVSGMSPPSEYPGIKLYKDAFVMRLEPEETVIGWYEKAGFEILEVYSRTDEEEGHPGFREERHSHDRIVLVARVPD